MTIQQFMAISQNTGLMCELTYLEVGESFSTKIKPVTGFSIEKTDICDYMVRFGFSDHIEFRTEKTFKPIIRPLSEADSIIRTEFSKFHSGKSFNKEIIDLFSFEHTNTSELLQEISIDFLPFDSVMWLIRNHFDIGCFVEKGEAIETNELPSFSYY